MGWRQFKIPRKGRATFYGLALLVSAVPATAQVVLNELLAENGLWNQDDEGDYEDWAELYNTSAQEVKLAGYTLTDDPALPRKWVLPDLSIPPHGYVLVWLSGKNRYSPAPVVNGADGRNPAFQPLYVKLSEEWRYLIADRAGSGPPAGWSTIGFNGGSWSVGRPGFGYGDGDDTTEMPVDTNAVFTRKKFTVAAPSAVGSLVLRVDYDDGFVVYLNGVRVAADGFGPGDPDFQSVAAIKREAGEPVLYDLTEQKALLVPGDNVLAVVGLNNIPSTDMSLAVELGAMPAFLHASFKLEKRGEYLGLSDAAGNLVDGVTFGVQTQDHSLARFPDGSGEWRYFLRPTPSAPNLGESFDAP